MTPDPTPPPDTGTLAAVFAGVEDGPRDLLTLTDAQLLAADGAGARRLVPLLSLTDETALAQEPSAVDVHRVRDPFVRVVLRLRRSWSALVLVDQRTAVSRDVLALYLRADRRVLWELAGGDGLHRFRAMTPPVAMDQLVAALNPFPDLADVDGEVRTYAWEHWRDTGGAPAAEARVVSAVTGLRNHLLEGDRDTVDERRLTVYGYVDHTEVLLPADERTMTVAAVSGATLRRHLRGLVGPPAGAGRGDLG